MSRTCAGCVPMYCARCRPPSRSPAARLNTPRSFASRRPTMISSRSARGRHSPGQDEREDACDQDAALDDRRQVHAADAGKAPAPARSDEEACIRRLAAVLVPVASRAATADVVHLKNGGRLVGRVEDDGERVRVVMAGGRCRREGLDRELPERGRRRPRRSRGGAGAPPATPRAPRRSRTRSRRRTRRRRGRTRRSPGVGAGRREARSLAGWRAPTGRSRGTTSPRALAVVGRDAGVRHRALAHRVRDRPGVARRRGEMSQATWRKLAISSNAPASPCDPSIAWSASSSATTPSG